MELALVAADLTFKVQSHLFMCMTSFENGKFKNHVIWCHVWEALQLIRFILNV